MEAGHGNRRIFLFAEDKQNFYPYTWSSIKGQKAVETRPGKGVGVREWSLAEQKW